MDGIIYGSVVGLGMAIEESLFFLDLDPPVGDLLPPAEIIRLCGHLVLGGITGFAIGMARFRMRGWVPALIGCLTVSMGLHFLWDWIAFSASRAGDIAAWQTVAAVSIMVGGMIFYGALVTRASAWSRAMFAPESRRRLWGWPFVVRET
jgi:RsiW-degrading membrane proteinase PrsW (M82 family)